MAGRILIVEGAAARRALLKAKLTSAYYDVVTARTAEMALAAVRSYAPDLVIVDADLDGPDGYALCRMLRAEDGAGGLPVVMTLPLDDAAAPLKALDAGADDFLRKPYSDAALEARLKNLLRIKTMADDLDLRNSGLDLGFADEAGAGDLRRGRVLIAADSAADAAHWSARLAPHVDGVSAIAEGADEALHRAVVERPDVCIVWDGLADGSDGLRLISALRAQPDGRETAVLFALDAEMAGRGSVEAAYDVGATDYLAFPFEEAELIARVRLLVRRKLRAERLRSGLIDRLRQAMTDPLTGVANRRHAIRQMNLLMAPGQRQAFAAVMLDLDRFKRVNDCYGHGAGDAVLTEFAQRLKALAGGQDTVARLGGEEFLVIVPGADRAAAAALAENIRAAVEGRAFMVAGVGAIRVTVSVGVAACEPGHGSPASVLEQADRALYTSKSAGRNTVTVASAA